MSSLHAIFAQSRKVAKKYIPSVRNKAKAKAGAKAEAKVKSFSRLSRPSSLSD